MRSVSKVIAHRTAVKTPPADFLLIIWTTPMTVPRMQMGMQRSERVV